VPFHSEIASVVGQQQPYPWFLEREEYLHFSCQAKFTKVFLSPFSSQAQFQPSFPQLVPVEWLFVPTVKKLCQLLIGVSLDPPSEILSLRLILSAAHQLSKVYPVNIGLCYFVGLKKVLLRHLLRVTFFHANRQ